MVAEWVPLDPAIENCRVVPAAWLAAEIVHLVMAGMLGLQETCNFRAGVPVKVLYSSGGEAVANYSFCYVCEVEIESIFCIAAFGL